MRKLTRVLRDDHDELRAKLRQLQEWLPHVDAARFTVRNCIRAIARRLRDHLTRKEHIMLSAAQKNEHGQAIFSVEELLHQYEPLLERCTVLSELLLDGRKHQGDQFIMHASDLIERVQKHIAIEEERVFPVSEGRLARNGARSP